MNRNEIKEEIEKMDPYDKVNGTVLKHLVSAMNGSLENLEDSINKNADSNKNLSSIIAYSTGILAIVGIINIVITLC